MFRMSKWPLMVERTDVFFYGGNVEWNIGRPWSRNWLICRCFYWLWYRLVSRYCTWLTERLLGWSMCRLLFGLTLSWLWSPIHWSRRRWFDQLFWRSRSWIHCRLLRRLNGRVQGRLSAWRFVGFAVGWRTGWKEGLQIAKLLSSNQLEIIIIITIIIIIISNS